MRNVCVFCSASRDYNRKYDAPTLEFGRELVRRDMGLVYGGSTVGLMGVLADEVLRCGGRVTGITTQMFVRQGFAHQSLSELVVAETMHERKRLMSERSDAFVALPGGVGTLEEILEMWMLAQLGIQVKPAAILNANGYFDKLLEFFEFAKIEGFIAKVDFSRLVIANDAFDLLNKIDIKKSK